MRKEYRGRIVAEVGGEDPEVDFLCGDVPCNVGTKYSFPYLLVELCDNNRGAAQERLRLLLLFVGQNDILSNRVDIFHLSLYPHYGYFFFRLLHF